jgi:F420-dependent NADP oxidoreductase-like protein
MKIGIIGAGEIGGTLTRRHTLLGHDVSVANSRDPETLAGLARETGHESRNGPGCGQGRRVSRRHNSRVKGPKFAEGPFRGRPGRRSCRGYRELLSPTRWPDYGH